MEKCSVCGSPNQHSALADCVRYLSALLSALSSAIYGAKKELKGGRKK